jgi:type I restriction enzyme S subunit
MKKLPDGWKFVKLSDIANISAGGTPRRNVQEYWNDGVIPWLKISDLKKTYINYSEEKITQKGLDDSSAKIFPKGTIVYSIFATLGAVGILDISATTNQAIAGIIPNNSLIETKYLYHCLQSEKNNILAKKSHATQDNINLTILRNHEIPLPPLPTQKKIAAVLEKAEKLREWRKEADGLTDRFLKSTFLELFGDPVKNPKGWDVNKLQNLLKSPFVNGLYVPKERYVKIGGIEMVHMSDAFYGVVKRGNLKQVDINEKELKKYNIDQNDILIARRSLNYEGSAKPCRIPQSNEPLVFESSLIKLSLNQNKILPIYLYYYLNNERAINAFVLKYVTKSTISGINQSGLNKIEIVTPPIELQNKFAGIVEHIEQMQVFQAQSRQHIENFFNVLMQRAFCGELEAK